MLLVMEYIGYLGLLEQVEIRDCMVQVLDEMNGLGKSNIIMIVFEKQVFGFLYFIIVENIFELRCSIFFKFDLVLL